MKIEKWVNSFIQIVYPSHCIHCGYQDVIDKSQLCFKCYNELPFTNFQISEEATSLDKLFWGRVLIEKSHALLFFKENSATQQILHELKYNNQKGIGKYFGQKIGEQLIRQNTTIQALIPVPLHHKKQFKRGYNQSESIARGINNSSKIPLELNCIKRIAYTDTQTKKNLLSRWDNMKNKFKVSNNIVNYEHIAIVDDVITTGSTIEAIVNEIRKVAPQIKISVIALAVTK